MKQQGSRDPFGITEYLNEKFPGLGEVVLSYKYSAGADGSLTLDLKILIDGPNAQQRIVGEQGPETIVPSEVSKHGEVKPNLTAKFV